MVQNAIQQQQMQSQVQFQQMQSQAQIQQQQMMINQQQSQMVSNYNPIPPSPAPTFAPDQSNGVSLQMLQYQQHQSDLQYFSEGDMFLGDSLGVLGDGSGGVDEYGVVKVDAPLPNPSTAVAEFSRYFFSVSMLLGFVMYWWDGVFGAFGSSEMGHNSGRVLNEYSTLETPFTQVFIGFLEAHWTLFMRVLLPLSFFFSLYSVLLVIIEPITQENSFFFREAQREHQKATKTINKSKKHHLRALAFLGRAFPTGLPLVLGIVFQALRYLLHCVFIGVWLDRLLIFARGGEASHKKAADLYLSLLRNCNGRMRTMDLLYLSFCTINISHLFDPIYVAETYAHVAFFTQHKFPSFRLLNYFLLQVAWRIAKRQSTDKDSQFMWLLLATSQGHLNQGNWSDADLYLKHISSRLARLEKRNQSLPVSALSLRRYTISSQAIVQLGLGNLPKSLELAKKAELICMEDENKPTNDKYAESAIARISMMISAVCLLGMDRTADAQEVVTDMVEEQERMATTSSPCAMFRLAVKGLRAATLHRQGLKEECLLEADQALNLFVEIENLELWIWPLYTLFVELYLEIWEAALTESKTKKAFRESRKRASFDLENNTGTEADEVISVFDTSLKVDKSYEDEDIKDQVELDKLARKAKECVRLFEEKSHSFFGILSSSARLRASFIYHNGKKEEAFQLWERSLEISRKNEMKFEEAKALYEIGRHKLLDTPCKCASRRSHSDACPISAIEKANTMFIKVGEVNLSRKGVEIIRTQ
eukprot:TRINITY_DN215_c0_g1_i1.p1 TRINITY_DN215_c0_g1~~TRINITY_DN215_c0_g1_i1.p1  ORF type:complete len:788 (-),score=327.98 TRINITY_DN215_c0_g1_i1:310-2598(-)